MTSKNKGDLPRGIRNNNPGNIRRSKDPWQGLAPIQKDEAFFTFKDPIYGIRALARLLINYQDKYKLRTIAAIIGRWAPEVENNTSAYVHSVEKQTGFPAKIHPVQADFERGVFRVQGDDIGWIKA